MAQLVTRVIPYVQLTRYKALGLENFDQLKKKKASNELGKEEQIIIYLLFFTCGA